MALTDPRDPRHFPHPLDMMKARVCGASYLLRPGTETCRETGEPIPVALMAFPRPYPRDRRIRRALREAVACGDAVQIGGPR